MRIEKREITTTVDVYIASDGREFIDEDECEAHECDLDMGKLTFYDADLDETDFDNCMYVKLRSHEDVSMLKDICSFTGIDSRGLKEPGVYIFDGYSRDYSWLNISDVVSKIMGGK